MPQGSQLLYTDSQFEYYKITVAKGTRMVEGKVAETCEKAGHGLKAVCVADKAHDIKCNFNDKTKCVITPLSGWCNGGGSNPMWVAQVTKYLKISDFSQQNFILYTIPYTLPYYLLVCINYL